MTGLFTALTPNMKTTWEEEFAGEPCVFICNHVGAFGPIYMVTKFPLKNDCYAWMNHDMLDPKLIPAYVRQDYWWKPGCALEPLYNATLPYLAAAVMPPVLNTVPGVKVHHDIQVIRTFRESIAILKEGEHLVIFPQQPSGYKSHHMWINKGFLQIAPMAWRSLGLALNFYPVHIDHAAHRIIVRKPVRFDPQRKLQDQEDEILEILAKGL
jgi:hypothetical protein